MIANLQDPIATIRGALGLGSDYYARMLHGQCVIQHKPVRSSQKQKEMRQMFGEVYKKTKKAVVTRCQPEADAVHRCYEGATR